MRRPRPFARLPRPWRWVARSATALLVVALLLVGTLTYLVRASFPQVDGELAIAGLGAEVQVLRDDTGVPHVYADTAADLFFAQGFVHAQDRFWEMDFRRHVTAGRLSELFGAATVDADRAVRTMGWRRVAQAELPLLEESTRTYLDAYARGVNAWLDTYPRREQRSLEHVVLGVTAPGYTPEPWTPVDSLAWLKAMAWDLRTNLNDELGRVSAGAVLPAARAGQLWPDYPFDRRPTVLGTGGADPGPAATTEPTHSPGPGPGAPQTSGAAATPAADVARPSGPGGADLLLGAAQRLGAVPNLLGAAGSGLGSNAWVVDGRHTTTGAPLLANDPHLGASLPSVWHQTGLHCRRIGPDCPFDVTGFSFSGVPGVIIGHTPRVAWGFTNLGQDVTDLSLERIDGATYLTPAGPAPLTVRTERIEVASGEPVLLEVAETAHGPIVSDVFDQTPDALTGTGANAVALQWTALTPGRTADAVFLLNGAQDWAGFRAAAERFAAPGQNLVYADIDGHIGYQASGVVPVRAAGDGRTPQPGWTGASAWTGTVPFAALPHVLDPPNGMIVTANNPVVGPPEAEKLTRDWSYGQRAARITERLTDLTRAGPVDVAAMAQLQRDDTHLLVPDLLDALRAVDLTGPAADARDLWTGWDGGQGVDSAAAAYFNATWRALLQATFADELPESVRPGGGGRWYEVVRALLATPDDPFWDDTTTPTREDRDDVLAAALTDAHADLAARLGDDPTAWRWGALHQLTLTHPSFGTSGIAPLEWLFNRGPVEAPGGTDAVNAVGWNARDGYAVTTVPSMRMVVDLADLDRSRWINLTGVSGHPFHQHYDDQTAAWAAGASTPMVSGVDAVSAAAVATLVLRPG